MTSPDQNPHSAYIEAQGGDPEKDFIDQRVAETMTPEGRDLVRRVMGSTPLKIQIFDTNSLRKHRTQSGE